MLHILTGEDIVSSRNKLNELLGGKKNIVRLDGKRVPISEIEMALESNNLFGDEKIIVIEQFSKIKPPDKLIELLLPFEKDVITTVVLWDEVELSVKIRTALKSAKISSYTFPKVYFLFLDGLSLRDSAGTITLLHQLLKTYSAEQVLYSIVKRIRQLLILKSDNYQESSEFKKMQSWQVGKLMKQSNLWTEEQLKKAFISFAGVDEKLKTSGLTMDLSAHLDILLLSDLN